MRSPRQHWPWPCPPQPWAETGNGNGPKGDVVHVGDIKVKKPRKQDLPAAVPAESAAAVAAAAAEESPPIGTVKIWPTINILTGGVSLSTFTLQGVGEQVEIWVAEQPQLPGRRLPQRRHPQRDHATRR